NNIDDRLRRFVVASGCERTQHGPRCRAFEQRGTPLGIAIEQPGRAMTVETPKRFGFVGEMVRRRDTELQHRRRPVGPAYRRHPVEAQLVRIPHLEIPRTGTGRDTPGQGTEPGGTRAPPRSARVLPPRRGNRDRRDGHAPTTGASTSLRRRPNVTASLRASQDASTRLWPTPTVTHVSEP